MSIQYKNPPIREVVCEFRFQEGSPWDLSVPGLIYSKMSDEFPRKLISQTPEISTTIVGAPEGRAQQTLRQLSVGLIHDSLRFWRSEDDFGFISVATNRISVSHSRPYPSWEVLLPIIMRTFNAYKDTAQPKGLQRIGLRYINEIYFDLSNIDLEDYFDFYPFQGPGLPQNIASFNCSIGSLFNDNRDGLRLQMTSPTLQQPGGVTVLLDLDYFLHEPLSVDLENVSDWLNSAHKQIEDTFEGCLKDSLRAKFQGEGK
jgi:uncharacterized protein (TIGR04255 family)